MAVGKKKLCCSQCSSYGKLNAKQTPPCSRLSLCKRYSQPLLCGEHSGWLRNRQFLSQIWAICDLGVLFFLSRPPEAEAGWGGWRPWLYFNFPTHSHIRPEYSVLNNRRKVISEKALSFLRIVPVLPDHGSYNSSVNDCDPWLTQEFSKRFFAEFFPRLFLWRNS